MASIRADVLAVFALIACLGCNSAVDNQAPGGAPPGDVADGATSDVSDDGGGDGGDGGDEGGAETGPEGGGSDAVSIDGASCGECTLWSASSCRDGFACRPSQDNAGPCTVCRTAGAGREGDFCQSYADCAAGFGCAESVCRAWCSLPAQAGQEGGCGTGDKCVSYVSLRGTSAGACLPCGECKPGVVDSCPSNRNCAADSDCPVCVGIGPIGEGGACTGHSDCARGLSCISYVCRYACLASATNGVAGACPSPLRCVLNAPGGDEGTCLPCGQCGLFDGPSCPNRFRCASVANGCTACLPTGTLPVGSTCSDHAQCQTGLFCYADRCRPYCRPGATADTSGACGAGLRCIPTVADPNVGACLPCGECGPARSCGTGLVCDTYGGNCAACSPLGTLTKGSACRINRHCASNLCLDGVCRDICPSPPPSTCGDGSTCMAIRLTTGAVNACMPCGECDLLPQAKCSAGFKCVANGPSCNICHPVGDHKEGETCQSASDCGPELSCPNAVCRKYCDPRDAQTCDGRCFGASSLPMNIGQCLHCGECDVWSADTCKPPGLKCNSVGPCATCEGEGLGGAEGSSCVSDGSCSRDLHCFSGLCRAYCKLGAASGEIGACVAGRTCQPSPGNLQTLGAGVCLP